MTKIYIKSIKQLIKNKDYELILNDNNERSDKRKNEKRAGEILLLEALKKENIEVDKKLNYQYQGTKPYLKDYPYYFNISHSGDKIILAISDQEVGVDIELIKKRRLSQNLVSMEEMSYFLQISDDDYESSVIKLWTIKEAFLKYLGTGITKLLKDVTIDDISVKLNDISARYKTFKCDNYYISVVSPQEDSYELKIEG